MKICGILIAKEKSIRFPGKNRLLWKANAEILIDCLGADNVYMFTDDDEIIRKSQEMGMWVIIKNINFHDEMSYLDALKYAYYSTHKKYDIIVTIMANTVGHSVLDVKGGVNKLIYESAVTEVRSFDDNGNQSGIFIFRADRLPEKWHHMASIVSNGKEIHYKEDLEK